MPKLPAIQHRFPVASLGRESIAGPARLAQAEAGATRAAAGVGFAALEGMRVLMKREDERAVEEAIVEYERQSGEWMAEMEQKRFYSAEEVPDELGVSKRKATTDQYGRTREALRAEIPAEEVGIGLYDMRMRGLTDSITSNLANDNQRRMFRKHADLRTVRGRNHMLGRLTTFKRETLRDTRLATIDSLVDANKWAEAEALLNETSPAVMSEREKTKKLLEIQELRVTKPVYEALAAGDESELEELYSDLSDPSVEMPGVSARARVQLATAVRTRLSGIKAERERQIAEAQSKVFHHLRVGIDAMDPSINPHSLDQAHQRGEIDDSQWDILRRFWTSKNNTAVQDQLDYLTLRDRVLPRNNSKARKVADKWYGELEQALASNQITQEEFEGTLGYQIAKWKYVPQGVQDHMFSMTNSNDPRQVSAGVRMWETMRRAAPAQVNGLNGFEDTQAIAALMRVGYEPERAIEMLNEFKTATDEQKNIAVDGLYMDYPKADITGYLNDWVDDRSNWETFFGRDPAVTGQVHAYFISRAEFYAKTIGNSKAALEAAIADVEMEYAVTDIDGAGRRVMALSPELVFGDDNAAIIKADLDRQLSAFVEGTESVYTSDNVYIMSTPMTVNRFQTERVVEYQVFDENMNPIVRPDNRRFIWRPDPSRTVLAAQEEAAAEAAEERRVADVFLFNQLEERAQQLIQAKGMSLEDARAQAKAEYEERQARQPAAISAEAP